MSDAGGTGREIALAGRRVRLRPLVRGDAEALLAFARAAEPHDLLFLQRDIRNARVVSAWFDQIASGQIMSLIAEAEDAVLGCTALVRDALSWSPHVAEIRILIGAAARGTGLGRVLADECLAAARAQGVEKVIVRMTPDQGAALKVFEDLGFHPEALLRDHVRDAQGAVHDIAIMALDLKRQAAMHGVYAGGGSGE